MPRKGERMPDQQRAKITAATRARWARGEPNPMQGRRRFDLRLKLPVKYAGAGNPFYGRQHSDAARAKMRAAAARRSRRVEQPAVT
jgi:hypothetical protein